MLIHYLFRPFWSEASFGSSSSPWRPAFRKEVWSISKEEMSEWKFPVHKKIIYITLRLNSFFSPEHIDEQLVKQEQEIMRSIKNLARIFEGERILEALKNSGYLEVHSKNSKLSRNLRHYYC